MKWIWLLAACASAPPPPAQPPPFDWTRVEIADPPDLPAVPDEGVCETFDLANPACRNDPKIMCAHADCKCPTPPDVENPACWAVMPCPSPPDRRVRACVPHSDAHLADAPVIGRILKTAVGSGVLVTISVGSDAGVSKTSHASVLRGDTDEVYAPATIIRVEARVTVARVTLTVDELNANPRVRFDP